MRKPTLPTEAIENIEPIINQLRNASVAADDFASTMIMSAMLEIVRELVAHRRNPGTEFTRRELELLVSASEPHAATLEDVDCLTSGQNKIFKMLADIPDCSVYLSARIK